MSLPGPNLEKLLEQIAGFIPKGAGDARDELRALMKASLTSLLTRMELVSREEFDAQALLLSRAHAKLAALEERISALEHPVEGSDAA